jgi:UDP-3-O-[3-hydroxymyristoyl] glucosamine N-acyltransferase
VNLSDVARIVRGRLAGDGGLPVQGVARPEDLHSSRQLAVALDAEGLEALKASRARIALVAAGMEVPRGLLAGWVSVGRPRYALSLLLPHFAPSLRCRPGVHPSAVVEPSARIAADASIGPLTYVGEGAVVGSGARVLANCTLGAGCAIGAGSLLHAGVRVGPGVRVGRDVFIQSNACVGSDGFSFATAEESGIESARHSKTVREGEWVPKRIPSLGTVVVEDEVEIGACTTIARGTLGETRIRRGSKIDNLVMVGHNSLLGEYCIVAGQSGISGSCRLGDRVAMGGQSGVADHMRIGSQAVIAAGSGVSQTVPDRSVFIDLPAIPYKRWLERYRSLGRLKRFFAELERLKQRLASLESVIAGQRPKAPADPPDAAPKR